VNDLQASPEPAAEPHNVVLAHGFTQTGRSWSRFESLLAQRLPTVRTHAVDLPGHGSSSELRCDLWSCADHLTTKGGRAIYVGYSLGGRIGLHAALAHPDLVQASVLIGATAGIDSADERRNRRDSDNELADRIETIGVTSFIDEWLAKPLFAGLTPETAQRAGRLRNTAEGLASSLRLAGTGTQQPLWERLAEIQIPVLVIAGENDKKFRTIGERLAELLPLSALEIIRGTGHPVHLEQPAATAIAIANWHLGLNSK
jgi:2-succinyl-6-hydroxy-2,4-cyclohexadiene-1-carboxylate synthase